MASTTFTLSSGHRVHMIDASTDVVPSEQYNQWATELGLPVDGTSLGMDGDDELRYFFCPGALGTANFYGFCSEGGIEFPVTSARVQLPVTSVQNQISIPNVSRMYSMANISYGPRMLLTFHPPYDAGSIGIKMRTSDSVCIIGGTIQRSGGQAVNFAVKIDAAAFEFKLVLSTPSGSAVPVYVQELSENGLYVAGSQKQVGTLSVGANLEISGYLHQAFVAGTVVDAAGNPASRIVRAHSRDSGDLIGSVVSGEDGSFFMKIKSKDTCYLVALDDDAAPDFNALIYDRITPESV